jgi:uncharacterized protein (DUF2267 family)
VDAADACRAVVATLRRNLSPDELNEVRAVLPDDIKEMWGDVL